MVANHNSNILAMHGEAVVSNKRAATTVVGHRARNSAVVDYPSACDGYVLHANCVAADHRVENPVDCGCPEGPNRLHVVTGPAGRDATAGQAEGVCIDDDDS